MNRETALICLNGDLDKALPHVEREQYDYVLAVDGALGTLYRLGIQPDAVIGDLDSATPLDLELAQKVGIAVYHIRDQETTDFEKAMQHIDEKGFGSVDIIGYRGNRLDHELAALEATTLYATHIAIRMIDHHAEGYVLSGLAEKTIRGKEGHVCSILPIHPCEGVSLGGFKWPLSNTRLGGGFPYSCSNQITQENASVTLRSGTLLIYLHRSREF